MFVCVYPGYIFSFIFLYGNFQPFIHSSFFLLRVHPPTKMDCIYFSRKVKGREVMDMFATTFGKKSEFDKKCPEPELVEGILGGKGRYSLTKSPHVRGVKTRERR